MKYDPNNKKLIEEPELKEAVINAYLHTDKRPLKKRCNEDDRQLFEW